MKKKWKIIFVCFALAMIFTHAVYADESTPLPDELESVIEGLPSEIEDHLPDEIHSDDVEGVASAVGKMASFEYIASLVGEVLGIELKKRLSLFSPCRTQIW